MPVIAHVISQLNVTYWHIRRLIELFKSSLLVRHDESVNHAILLTTQSHSCTVRCDQFSNYHGFVRTRVAHDFLVAVAYIKSGTLETINQFFMNK